MKAFISLLKNSILLILGVASIISIFNISVAIFIVLSSLLIYLGALIIIIIKFFDKFMKLNFIVNKKAFELFKKFE